MLQERHRHTGSPGDGPKIHIKDIQDAGRFMFIPAGEFNDSDTYATQAVAASSNLSVISLTNGQTGNAYASFMMPPGKRGISKLTMYYYNEEDAAVLRFDFHSLRIRAGEALVTDSTSVEDFTTPSASPKLETIVIPRSAYDGINASGLKTLDVVGVNISRDGGDAADTYDTDLDIVGLLVEFS